MFQRDGQRERERGWVLVLWNERRVRREKSHAGVIVTHEDTASILRVNELRSSYGQDGEFGRGIMRRERE